MTDVYKVPFRGKEFLITTVGSSNPEWLLHSFFFEADLRNEWWNIKPGDAVIDVGSAYGFYTLSALAAGAACVISVEPGKEETFDLLTNLNLNHFTHRCLQINALAGEAPGQHEYYPTSHSYRAEGTVEKRLVVTVDDLVRGCSLGDVDWIKIDVEGAELSVLQGAIHTIRGCRPTILVGNHVGFVPGVDSQIREFFSPLGYEEVNIKKPTGVNDNWSKWSPK